MRARTWVVRLAAGALAVLAAGCELRTAVDVELEDDGGGRLAVTLEADEELAAGAGEQPVDPLDQLADVGATLGPGWDVEARPTEEGGRSVTLASRFDDPGELERRSAALAQALAAPELDPLDGFAVTVDREQIRITGRAALEPTDEVADFGLDPPAAVAQLADTVDYRIRVSLAGEVLESTAEEQRDGTLIWPVPAGGSVEILAVAARPQRPWARLVAGAAGLLLVAGLLGWWWVRRRRVVPAGQDPGGWSRSSSTSTSA